MCRVTQATQLLYLFPTLQVGFAMGPTWHNGRPMTTIEYKVELCNFKEAALLKRCWFARDMIFSMIWRRADFVDPHTGMLLFGQEVDLESD